MKPAVRTSVLRRLAVPAAAALLGASVAAADVVERRGTEPALEGTIGRVDDAGVVLTTDLGATHLVPWDRVRSLEPADPKYSRLMGAAEDLWRARSRVERNDMTLAEPLLERLFEQYRGRTHETALVVAEGLLRCRLRRGDHVLAVIPALEVARLRRAGVTTDSYATLDPIFDSTYDLCTQLAPAWVPGRRLDSLAHDLDTYDAGDDAVVAAMAVLYRRAALRGQSADAAGRLPDHAGVRLLATLVDAGSDDGERGRAAQRQLERELGGLPDWAEAWARFALGMALLGDPDDDTRHRGAVSLIHLPARFPRTQPYLAGLALARVAELVEADGDAEAAEILRNQLRERHLYLFHQIEGHE